jgi:hypothetical protein
VGGIISPSLFFLRQEILVALKIFVPSTLCVVPGPREFFEFEGSKKRADGAAGGVGDAIISQTSSLSLVEVIANASASHDFTRPGKKARDQQGSRVGTQTKNAKLEKREFGLKAQAQVHLCIRIQASMRSNTGSSSSQYPLRRSAFRRSLTTCSSVMSSSSWLFQLTF